MPIYTYRREDGSTFDYKQKFTDDSLAVDPTTGQKVFRVVQATSVIFKGSGFYVNDSKGKSSTVTKPKHEKSDGAATSESKSDSAPSSESKSDTKSETTVKAEPKHEAKSAPVAASVE